MSNVKKLTRILDKLIQVGPSYLDQTLRSYVTENKEYRLYTDYHPDSHPGGEGTANTYAVFSYFSSGTYKTEVARETDILIVAGGGGGTIGNASGGSGGGEVIEIRNAVLPAGEYVITIGAGGAGASNPGAPAVGQAPIAATEAQGNVGNDSSVHKTPMTNRIVAKGGGVGGYRQYDTNASVGGSGGGAGGADHDPGNVGIQPAGGSPFYQGAGIHSHTVAGEETSQYMLTGYLGDNVTTGLVQNYGEPGGDSDAYALGTVSTTDTYTPGGGGGAAEAGKSGTDTKGGDGGDGVSIDWVNEVFNKVYKFNGNIHWAAGGGASCLADKEPGNGGLGGGGGGASFNQLGASAAETEIYWNGKGGLSGFNPGYDAAFLKGGAGGQNTGSGAGGSCGTIASNVGNHIHRTITQGPNGGSGFVLIRVRMNDIV